MEKIQAGDFNQLYNFVEAYRAQITPFRMGLLAMQSIFNSPMNIYSYGLPGNILRATIEVTERLTRHYEKPQFGITECKVDGKTYNIEIEDADQKPFCTLLHFSKKGCPVKLPKLMIVAPMAGHHATLLRGTVEDLLPYFDIYITDWISASQVPVFYGKFDLDDYIDYLIEFFRLFRGPLHVLAVCQPTVPVMAAAAIMSDEKSKHLPKSIILMGGPIDARANPTVLTEFAEDHSIKWFEDSVITTVPNNLAGAGRKVYPGFLQLSGFIGMNWQRHLNSYMDLFKDLVLHNDAKADIHKKFYDEYLSVMDLPAEFYIQTIREVFQKFSLAKGKMKSRGREVDVEKITEPALLGIEGEHDDIAAVGQTRAALEICTNIPKSRKQYYLQKGVGHYGVFSGSKFREFIVPAIKEFAYKFN